MVWRPGIDHYLEQLVVKGRGSHDADVPCNRTTHHQGNEVRTGNQRSTLQLIPFLTDLMTAKLNIKLMHCKRRYLAVVQLESEM